jgi:uncharacterized protein YodC (DUF2158 family)
METEKVYFLPGDVVTIKQNIPNKPTMMVVKKKTLTIRPDEDSDKSNFLQGILCRWFTTEGLLQEAVFNTKDIYKL